MGLNFHIRCQTHQVVGMIARGHETEVLHEFYREHEACLRENPNAVEVQGDEASQQLWMISTPTGYTNLGLLTKEKR
jgi:hypothetical protein